MLKRLERLRGVVPEAHANALGKHAFVVGGLCIAKLANDKLNDVVQAGINALEAL